MLSGPSTVFGLNPLATETVPSHPLGTLGISPDGRKFRYALNNSSAAAVAGELQQGRVEDTGEQSILMAVAAIGATQVTTADTVTVTANQYANGYIVSTAEGGTGNGYMYRIKSHPAVTAAVLTVELYNPIVVAFSASTQVDFVPSLYDGVTQYLASPTSAPAGVAVAAIPASSYGWLQTGGVGIVKADAGGAIAVGQGVVASNATAGCVEDVASTTQPVIGTAITGIAQAEFGLAFLILD